MLTHLVHRHDRRVAEPGRAASLAQEPVTVLARSQAAGAGDLHGHDAIELRVASLVDGPEGSDSDRFDQFEPSQTPLMPSRAPGGRRLPFQTERRAAGGANDLAGGETDELDGVAAMRTTDVHVQGAQATGEGRAIFLALGRRYWR